MADAERRELGPTVVVERERLGGAVDEATTDAPAVDRRPTAEVAEVGHPRDGDGGAGVGQASEAAVDEELRRRWSTTLASDASQSASCATSSADA